MHKSHDLKDVCEQHGWQAQVKPDTPIPDDVNQIVWNLYAIRGNEALHVSWLGNRFRPGTYTYGSYRKVLTWRNEVVAVIKGRPDSRKLKSANVETLSETRQIPWTDETPADKILSELLGRKISWVRKIDNEVCDAVVPVDRNRKHLKISESSSGKRVLEWADTFGFHAVHIDSIIEVA